MLTITSRGVPPAGAHWSYGSDYMRQIGKAAAMNLCGMYPLPQMGYETVVAMKSDGFGGYKRLHVQNISGTFYAASTDARVADWPETFGVRLVEA